jgi:membrane fusion protein (multidrug efflux system)
MYENALLVPQQAVTEVQGRYQVAVVQPDNTIKIVNVQAGDKYQNLWVIESGLKPGDRVVSEGTSKVRDGERVNPQPNQTKPVSPYGSQGEEQ